MPNQIDADGLEVKSLSEIIADLQTGLRAIYGADANVESNSPDGQLIGIFSQACADLLALLLDVYNSFTVPNAYGVILDQRVALNGLARKDGTYTTAEVLIAVNQALTLPGQDQSVVTPFTVSDSNGNQYQLVASHVFSAAGSATLTFKASIIGQVETTPNTITNQVTQTNGVTSVNNPSVAGDVIGTDEETDAQLKVRHAQSFALASTGPADALAAALKAIPDVSDAFVAENDTGSDADGVPAHGVWIIVNGGTAAEVGTAIYSKKIPGCAMVGDQSYVVTRPAGNSFTALWDNALAQDLYVQFGLVARVVGATFDADVVKAALVQALQYKLGQSPTIGDVIVAMLAIAPDFYLTGVGVSDDGMSYDDVIVPNSYQEYFVLDAARIDIS